MCDCACDWEGGGGTWEDISSSWHKARKPHRCEECGATIAKGERYHRTVGKWEGDLVSNATCATCERISAAHWAGVRVLQRRPGNYREFSYVVGELRCAVGCLTRDEPDYRAAFRQSWHGQKAAA